jgi:hypothetical protein
MVFNKETYLPVYLSDDIGWIFIETDNSRLIYNKFGVFRRFYKGLNENTRSSDYHEYILCENEVNGKICFRTHKLDNSPNTFCHNCCDCTHPHSPQVKETSESSIPLIEAEIKEKGVEEALRDRYFKLITDHRMPFTQAASGTFRDLIYASILAGRLDDRSPDKLFPQLTRKRISELARSKGKVKINDWLWRFSGKEVSVVLDAGMAGNDNTIVCLICCPQLGFKPFLFQSYTKGTKRSNYAKLCARIVFDLKKYGITVASFVTDGLKRQVEACDPWNPEGFVRYLKILFEIEKKNVHPFAPPDPPSWAQKSKKAGVRITPDSISSFFFYKKKFFFFFPFFFLFPFL